MNEDYFLSVKRSAIWPKAKAFYKAAQYNPSLLKVNLAIDFVGEPGVDCGAIKREYFTLLMSEMCQLLFEGAPTRKVPRRDYSLEEDFELAGMAVAHSIMQHGPSFSCLSPALYPLTLAEECGIWDDYLPTRDDIPQNASTANLLEFVDKVCVMFQNIFLLCRL